MNKNPRRTRHQQELSPTKEIQDIEKMSRGPSGDLKPVQHWPNQVHDISPQSVPMMPLLVRDSFGSRKRRAYLVARTVSGGPAHKRLRHSTRIPEQNGAKEETQVNQDLLYTNNPHMKGSRRASSCALATIKARSRIQGMRSTSTVVSSASGTSDASESGRTDIIDEDLGQSTLWSQLSTSGSCKVSYPDINGLDLGFTLPPTPKTIDEARSYLRSLLRQGGLPSRDDYQVTFNGLRQNRLLYRILSDLRKSLVLWTHANPTKATYVQNRGRAPRYQISPLPTCFKTPTTRDQSFDSWHRALSSEAREDEEVKVFMREEFKAYATIKESTFYHRANSTNMYICSTQDHPSYGQSFAVRPWRNIDSTTYQELVADGDARDRHSGRNGSGHEFVVLIDETHQPYIYDPSFAASDWSDKRPDQMRLGNAPFLKRAHELLLELTRGREKKLKREVIVGGGGNPDFECRTMAVKWFVARVAQWMGVHVRGAPGEMTDFVTLRL